jgi:hypothetical protein
MQFGAPGAAAEPGNTHNDDFAAHDTSTLVDSATI